MKYSTFYILLLIIGIITIFSVLAYDDSKFSTINASNSEDIVSVCEDLDLVTTSKCITQNIGEIYSYRLNADSNVLTFEELKEEGGDCKDWNLLVMEIGKRLGFNSEVYRFDITNKKGHLFAKLSDETGYCILDQEAIVGCFKFGGENESS